MPMYPSTGILMSFSCHFNQLLETSVPPALWVNCALKKCTNLIFHFTSEANHLCGRTLVFLKVAISSLDCDEEELNQERNNIICVTANRQKRAHVKPCIYSVFLISSVQKGCVCLKRGEDILCAPHILPHSIFLSVKGISLPHWHRKQGKTLLSGFDFAFPWGQLLLLCRHIFWPFFSDIFGSFAFFHW